MIVHSGSDIACNRCGTVFNIKDVVIQTSKYEIVGFSFILINNNMLVLKIPEAVASRVLYQDWEFYHEACFVGSLPGAKSLPLDPLKIMLRDMDPRERQRVYEFMYDVLGCRRY